MARSKYARQAKREFATNSKAWRSIRAIVLADDPLCQTCKAMGYIVEAKDVDHIDGDSHNNVRSNLQSLCHSCHSRKTASGNVELRITGVDGFPVRKR